MKERNVWIVAFNQDYHESSRAFSDPRRAVVALATELGCAGALEAGGADEEFWQAVAEAYDAGKWKGLTVHRLDLETLEMEKLSPEDLAFDRSDLSEFLDDGAPEPI